MGRRRIARRVRNVAVAVLLGVGPSLALGGAGHGRPHPRSEDPTPAASDRSRDRDAAASEREGRPRRSPSRTPRRNRTTAGTGSTPSADGPVVDRTGPTPIDPRPPGVGARAFDVGNVPTGIDGPNAAPRIVTGSIEFTKRVIDDTVDDTHFAVAADFDGDGDVDLAATDFVDDAVYAYDNDGDGNFTRRTIDDALDGAYPAHVADVDLDGDVDVLAGGYLGDTYAWYENDGAGGFTRHDVDTAADGAHSIVDGDVDGDGDVDLVAADQDAHAIAWYENDGQQSFTRHTVDGGAVDAKRAVPADLDGDGDVDLVSASFGIDEIAWHENDGAGSFTRRTIDATADGAYFVSTADLDGDGDLDVLAASQLDATIAWYENDGGGTFVYRAIDTTASGARAVVPADVDGDGDVDALSANADEDTILWHDNDGTGAFATRIVDDAADGAYGVFPVDIDRDGDLDVVSASRDANAVAVHTHIRAHDDHVEVGETLVVDASRLRTEDVDDPPERLTYTLTDAPLHGDLRRDGVPMIAGDRFTQADVDGGLVDYVHDGADRTPDRFDFSVSDGGGGGFRPSTGTFSIRPTGFVGVITELPLDEGSGTLAADVGGLGNHGTLVGGPSWDPATGDGSPFAVRLDGVDDYVDLGALDVDGAGLSLVCRFRADAFPGPSSDPRLISKATGTASDDHVFMLGTVGADGAVRLRVRVRVGGATTTLVAAAGDLATSVWYHATATHDGKTLRLYLDGVEVGSAPLPGFVDTDPTVAVAIGAQPPGAGARFFDGALDDVRILSRALTPAEVADLAGGGAP